MTTADDLRRGVSPVAAQELFDSLPPVGVDEILGRWRGSVAPSGHPMDGLLATAGWYGKEFIDAETVHPLLFGAPGRLYAVNPRLIPLRSIYRVADRLPSTLPPGGKTAFRALRTTAPRARLRTVDYGGIASAAMVYDDLPIIDHFRRLDQNTLFGLMDRRGDEQTCYFLLERD
ncbi:DUF4334 domain-containing protein [Gordonia sp. (in: high G+C Gram-positive bacteria)]|uniref:DUF4334 domain-containing protein n=1 Tax=Gordonia sp. (in: high G+C Gram-positive bacteria) TaxID=84139 RepID=UPI00262DCA8F|nr:DUF4334 domain-containing protein [Gordonia sp. (in: high G+C Gram-positive bacteria)]